MKRYLTAFLLAHSTSMTLLAAWLGARAFLYWRIVTVALGMKANSPTHEQVLANIGAPGSLPGSANETAMLVAGLDPSNLAATAFVIMLSCLVFASRRQARTTTPDLKKD